MDKKPECFGSFSDKSQFCVEVCRFASECGGHIQDPQLQVQMMYKRGEISFKEMLKERMAMIEYNAKNKKELL